MARFKTNMNTIKKDQSAFETGGSGANWFKLVDGKQVIRFLPPWSEEGVFYKKVGYHRPPGRSMDKVVCPDYTFGAKGECPICKARARVFKDLGKDAAKDYNIQKRALVNVLDMKKADGVVYVMDSPASIMNPILTYMAEEESDQLVDPDKGYNVLVVRKNEGGFTKYEVMIKPGEYDLADNGYDVDNILDNLVELDKFVKEPDADDFGDILDALNAKAYGEDSEEAVVGIDDEDETEEDEQPAAKKPAGKKKLQSKKVVDDEDDDEDDEPVAKKATKSKPAPAKAGKKKPAPIDEDPEDEDDGEALEIDEEDDQDDEPVAKKPAAKKGKLTKKAAPVEEEDDGDEIDMDLAGIDEDFEGFDENEEIPF